MAKFQEIKLNKDALLAVLCVLGTLAVAWWAWAAGPVEPRPALTSTPQAETAQSLDGSPYGSVSRASPANSAGSASSGSGNASSPVMSSPVVPANPPSYPTCYPVEGVQSNIVTCPPYDCGAIRYPCCQYTESPQAVCGCGGRGTELLCASPL